MQNLLCLIYVGFILYRDLVYLGSLSSSHRLGSWQSVTVISKQLDAFTSSMPLAIHSCFWKCGLAKERSFTFKIKEVGYYRTRYMVQDVLLY